MLRQINKNKDGVVLVTVLMIVLTMMVLVLSIISMRVSSVTVSDSELKQIQSELLAKGLLAYMSASLYNGVNSTNFSESSTLDDMSFSGEGYVLSPSAMFNGTNSVQINISY